MEGTTLVVKKAPQGAFLLLANYFFLAGFGADGLLVVAGRALTTLLPPLVAPSDTLATVPPAFLLPRYGRRFLLAGLGAVAAATACEPLSLIALILFTGLAGSM